MDSDHGQLTWIKDHCYGGWIKPAAECARPYNKHCPMKQGLQLMRKASATVGVFKTSSNETSGDLGKRNLCKSGDEAKLSHSQGGVKVSI